MKKSQPAVTTDSSGFHEQDTITSSVNQVNEQLTAQRDSEITKQQITKQQMQQQMANCTEQDQMMEQVQLTAMSAILQTQANNNNQHQ